MEQYCMGCMRKRPDNEKICPVCGWDHSSTGTVPFALPPGTFLHGVKYIIGRVLGQGGFGITYIGYDTSLQMKVAVKEYYPQSYAGRATGTSSLTWSISEDQKKACWERFIKEARMMAKIKKIPQVAQVLEVFCQNDTAYIIMDFVEGETLNSRIQKNGIMGEKECMELLKPAMKSLASAHKQGLIHRDISPDNLMIDDEGRVWIIDLGAAKEMDANQVFQGGATQSQTVVRRGFSPKEQFLNNGKIGPWTDVYAFSATIYYAITGIVPTDALSRIENPTIMFPPGISERMKQILYKGLSMKSEERFQTIDEMLDAWDHPEEKHCVKCGRPLPDNGIFCAFCGTPVSGDIGRKHNTTVKNKEQDDIKEEKVDDNKTNEVLNDRFKIDREILDYDNQERLENAEERKNPQQDNMDSATDIHPQKNQKITNGTTVSSTMSSQSKPNPPAKSVRKRKSLWIKTAVVFVVVVIIFILKSAAGVQETEETTETIETLETTDISSCYINVDESQPIVYDGTPKTPKVVIKDGPNELNSGLDYTIAYDDNISPGLATITIGGSGNYSGTIKKTFKIDKAEQNISAEIADSYVRIGNTTNIKAEALGSITYKSSDPDVATVDENGKIKARKEGNATIIVEASETDNYKGASKECEVQVIKRNDAFRNIARKVHDEKVKKNKKKKKKNRK